MNNMMIALLLVFVALINVSNGFMPVSPARSNNVALDMGLFDGISKAFSNAEVRQYASRSLLIVDARTSPVSHWHTTSHTHVSSYCNIQFASPPEGIKATARHILVKSEDEVKNVVSMLSDGASFANVARDFSTCPSGKQGGSLGSFSPGAMVKEFDAVIFSPDTGLGEVVGPVKTKFGYHLIVVDKRTGV